ncbi:hypothetical protein OR1_02733 [Geobacter sp. OR-1]|uniref:hypothetical protein n=1 Tax=Geobacter sp. OR-1 TaxID=1266765 RepID=UPI0005443240|nr:hypothetical protein [Geobacter sp. OR-1]GAM10444.1 hypothetical protein OR1_02733 [Geobacter sp. OR-1]
MRRDHNEGYPWDHNIIPNQDGFINSLIMDGKSLNLLVDEFVKKFPEYKGSHRGRVLRHVNHLVKEHDDFPYVLVEGYFKVKN